jgi:hypothetical protein
MADKILSTLNTPLGAVTWVASLAAMLAVFESGTPKGRSLAKQNLQRMAELADLAVDAVKTVERIVTDDHVRGTDICAVITEARRLSHARPGDNSREHPAAPSPDGEAARACGVLAKGLANLELPLDICCCGCGYYIGTFCDAQPYTRESHEYWPHRKDAAQALQTGAWTQRVHA